MIYNVSESQERLRQIINDHKWYYWCFLLVVTTALVTLNKPDNLHCRSSIKAFCYFLQ